MEDNNKFFLDGKEAQAAFGIMQDKIKELNNANTILQAKLQIAQEKLKSLDDKQQESEDTQSQQEGKHGIALEGSTNKN